MHRWNAPSHSTGSENIGKGRLHMVLQVAGLANQTHNQLQEICELPVVSVLHVFRLFERIGKLFGSADS